MALPFCLGGRALLECAPQMKSSPHTQTAFAGCLLVQDIIQIEDAKVPKAQPPFPASHPWLGGGEVVWEQRGEGEEAAPMSPQDKVMQGGKEGHFLPAPSPRVGKSAFTPVLFQRSWAAYPLT